MKMAIEMLVLKRKSKGWVWWKKAEKEVEREGEEEEWEERQGWEEGWEGVRGE